MRPLLFPQLLHEHEVDNDGDPLTWFLGAGVVALLRVSTSHFNFTVPRSQAARWGVEDRELWAIALHNLRREPYSFDRAGLDERPLYLLHGKTEYTSANLLRLEELVDGPAPHGMLVLSPENHWLVFWVIPDAAVITAARSMQQFGRELWKKAGGDEGGFSPHVYWWSDGELEIIVDLTQKNDENNPIKIHSPRFSALIIQFSEQSTPPGQP